MKVAIDIGSNSVRMLVGESFSNYIVPLHYFRSVTRLAGGYDPVIGISADAGERTLCALESFSKSLREIKSTRIRVVATEAVRRAVNSRQFVAEVLKRTGFTVEIINGDEEADLSFAGVLSALKPQPDAALIFDIGGGSTEFIISKAGKRLWQKSYPLGVVDLAETTTSGHVIERILDDLLSDIKRSGFISLLDDVNCEFVGTAGTVTTLAAIDLSMKDYDWQLINNHVMPRSTLCAIYDQLHPLTPNERELVCGVESGRGDLIVPGTEVVLSLLDLFSKNYLKVSDFGLLEGALLSI